MAAPAAIPRPAVAMAAPPVELEELAEEEPVEEALDLVEDLVEVPEDSELEPVVRGVLLLPEVVMPLFWGVTTGEVRPAGIEAAGSWEVAAAGWLVMTEG